MPVGLFADAVYEDRMHALPEGFSLVLLSDGVMELLAGNTLADKESRLREIVAGGGITVDALGHALALDGGREVPDDVAMLVIHDAPASARTEGAS